jgi:hypothetical protein
VFGLFKRHHAFRGTTGPKADVLRCGICGIAETAIKHYKAQGEIQ